MSAKTELPQGTDAVPMLQPSRSAAGRRSFSVSRFVAGLLIILLMAAVAWFGWVFSEIRYYATHDQASAADAIAVFGAAEYDGHPSPTLRARLDHALVLYKRGIAPMVITLGGQGDARHSEGSVGRDYLVANGIPESHIIAETRSNNTESSAEQLAIIVRANQLDRVVAVSDGTHLFRIRALCRRSGLAVLTSPHPPGRPISRKKRIVRVLHEMVSYSIWRLGLPT